MGSSDRIAVIGFSDEAIVYSNFSSNKQQLKDSISQISAGGETSLCAPAGTRRRSWAALRPTGGRPTTHEWDFADVGRHLNHRVHHLVHAVHSIAKRKRTGAPEEARPAEKSFGNRKASLAWLSPVPDPPPASADQDQDDISRCA